MDTIESIAVNANRVLAEFGYPPNEIGQYRYFAGDGQEELIARAMRAAGAQTMEEFPAVLARYRELFRDGCMYHVRPFPGMRKTLETLKEKGVRLAVFSNKADENVKRMIYEIFGEAFFDAVLGARPDYQKKPSREGVDRILSSLGLQPEECVYVGDTSTDMKTGTGAGIFTVGVLWGFRDRAELEQYGADRIIERPEELLEVGDCV